MYTYFVHSSWIAAGILAALVIVADFFRRLKRRRYLINIIDKHFYFDITKVENQDKFFISVKEDHYVAYAKLYGAKIIELDRVTFESHDAAIEHLRKIFPDRLLLSHGENLELRSN